MMPKGVKGFQKGNKIGVKFQKGCKPIAGFKKGNTFGSERQGDKNPNWKGDNVSMKVLHKWIRRHLASPEFCQMCNKNPHEELANITGVYNREFKNWLYLCLSCHRIWDGAINNIK